MGLCEIWMYRRQHKWPPGYTWPYWFEWLEAHDVLDSVIFSLAISDDFISTADYWVIRKWVSEKNLSDSSLDVVQLYLGFLRYPNVAHSKSSSITDNFIAIKYFLRFLFRHPLCIEYCLMCEQDHFMTTPNERPKIVPMIIIIIIFSIAQREKRNEIAQQEDNTPVLIQNLRWNLFFGGGNV